MSSKFLLYLTAMAMLMVFCTPAVEGTFLLIACLTGSPICPFRTTTPRCGTSSTYSPVTRECG